MCHLTINKRVAIPIQAERGGPPTIPSNCAFHQSSLFVNSTTSSLRSLDFLFPGREDLPMRLRHATCSRRKSCGRRLPKAWRGRAGSSSSKRSTKSGEQLWRRLRRVRPRSASREAQRELEADHSVFWTCWRFGVVSNGMDL